MIYVVFNLFVLSLSCHLHVFILLLVGLIVHEKPKTDKLKNVFMMKKKFKQSSATIPQISIKRSHRTPPLTPNPLTI